ncbi:MAG: sulfatase-like hydrolase/transferase [Thermodesulfobacteriota bacterium]
MAKIKVKALLRKCSRLLIGIISSSKSSFAFFICLLAMVFIYRIQLTIGLFTNPVRPFDFNPAHYPMWFTLAYLPCDFAFVLVCFLLSWFLSRMTYSIKQSKTFPILKISGLIFLHIILMILLLVHGVHGRLLFDVQTGFDTSVIKETFSDISFIETLKLIEVRDCLFLLFPFGLFWLVLLSPISLRIWMARVSIILVIFLSSLSILAANDKTKNIPDEIRLNPAIFLLTDVAENIFFKPSVKDRNSNVVKGNRSGIQLSRSMETNSIEPVKFLPPKSTHPWNIVFFVMESVGTRYIFDTSNGNPMPMPFLHKISQEGWYLKRHYTTSNVSTKAIFSLFSGHYDFFNRKTFGTRPDAEVPAIYNWLGEGYDSFLVTPSSISWYFPTKFVKNNGLSEIHSYENLKFKIKEEFHSLGHYIARDEIQTVDFFIRRLSKAREPFLGIYISFAAHFPYFDYGEGYRILEDDGRLISRYYNNLNLLDHMIQRIVDHLQEQGLLERTILVIVGDHGQAFGQHHPNNFMHYRYSYNENLEAPAILYQPALFKPRVFGFPTSHVDILPTLLDAMRVPYPPMVFDGESLFNYTLRRKSIFFYGYEESISSLDTHLIKVQYSLKKNRCWAFDLKLDPEEKNLLDCSLYSLQLEALHKFVSDHDSNLLKYNANLREKKGFQGTQAPVAKD